MKRIILSFLLTPIFMFSQIADDMSVNKKLYTKGSFVFGPGFEKFLVAEVHYRDSDKDNEEVHISPGGGAGIEGVIGYDISKSLSCEFALGWENSGKVVDKDNSAMFNKYPLRASVLYRIIIDKKYTPYIGAGISTVLSAKYTEDSQGTEHEATYTKPVGFHVLGGAEWKNPQSSLFFFGEVRLLLLGEFEAEEATVSDYALETIGLDKMNANGVQFTFGIGYYL
ncbi:opacity family porin [Candidatus Neomarinimicrobiota bacterium]